MFPKKISPFLGDILFTSIVAVVVAICNIFVIRIIGKGLGAEELGIYTLVRRTVATVLPFSSLSIGIGIARYIALYAGKGENIRSVLPVALTISSITSLLICLLLLPFSELFSELIFNAKDMALTFKLILFLLFGENLFTCLYAYYRGRQKMLQANIWGGLVMGIMPLVLALLIVKMNNVNYIIFGLGLLFYLSLLGLVPNIVNGIRETNYEKFKETAKKLLMYSVPRAPGLLAYMLLLTFGVLVSPYTGSIAHAAYLTVGIWILQILQTATESFGLVVLPKVANILGGGNEKYLVNKIRSIYDFVLHIGIFTVIQLFLLLDFLIFVWLGIEYSGAVPIARVIILSMIFFFYYTMMRNIIDAVEKKAINAVNVYRSLFVTILSSIIFMMLGLGVLGLAIGLNLGLMSLGTLTWLFMKQRYHVNLFPNKFYRILIVNLLMGFCIYLIKYEMMSNRFNYINFSFIVFLQLVIGLLYLIILKKLGATWLKDIESRITFHNSNVN